MVYGNCYIFNICRRHSFLAGIFLLDMASCGRATALGIAL
jgi:hypothetical protein